MDVSQKCLIGECWVPLREVTKVQAALIKGGVSLQTVIIIISIYWMWYVAYVEKLLECSIIIICNIKEETYTVIIRFSFELLQINDVHTFYK